MEKFIINDDYDDMNYRKEYLLKELKEYFVNDNFEVRFMKDWKDITPRQRIWLIDLLDMIFDFKYKLISTVNFYSELGKLKEDNTKKIINDKEYYTKLKELYNKFDMEKESDDFSNSDYDDDGNLKLDFTNDVNVQNENIDVNNDNEETEEIFYKFPDECFDDCKEKIKELCENDNFDYLEINRIILSYLEKRK